MNKERGFFFHSQWHLTACCVSHGDNHKSNPPFQLFFFAEVKDLRNKTFPPFSVYTIPTISKTKILFFEIKP